MFRKPRENNGIAATEQVLPFAGRPPTPPSDGVPSTSPFFQQSRPTSKVVPPTPVKRLPVLGTIPQSKILSGKKNQAKQNHSILNFFGKAEKKEEAQESVALQDDLFFDGPLHPKTVTAKDDSQDSLEESSKWAGWSQEDAAIAARFNESDTPVKRRRVKLDDSPSNAFIRTPSPERRHSSPVGALGQKENGPARVVKRRGGFIDDSSDDEGSLPDIPARKGSSAPQIVDEVQDEARVDGATLRPENKYGEATETETVSLKPPDEQENDSLTRPHLTRQGTSGFQVDEFGPEDFDDEFFPEGEEYTERRYMEEQLAMERAFEDDSKSDSGTDGVRTPKTVGEVDPLDGATELAAECPMCSGSLKGLSETEASTHVNACLDGTAKPLPKASEAQEQLVKPDPQRTTVGPGPKRFQRAAVARPGQANPFSLTQKEGVIKSAFSQLMSGHAEDRAWAEAASNEAESRGKPAYHRTCPFYKIMPGLSICVDAFRYGKVEGQNAYFLSHFHSDHYIGLTSQWCHGPIYASKVTCNLMKQQLRVDPKWIVPLEFEQKIEVPNTGGVVVTMIPANHCPGSSLYLFEKRVGKNKDGSPKLNRILHCGDFRACPAHIQHPLLKPDVMDAVTGQTKNQFIDTCYLDTTYLTPKYSFPSQSDVIDACAQMCVSLSKEIPATTDAWEQVKLEGAGGTMKKFLELGTAGEQAESRPDSDDGVKAESRGRLLVVIGTYSIGKERMCLGIARALDSKIFAPPSKMRICRALEDDELNSRLTANPLEAQVHMQMLMEIRAETLYDYLVGFKPHFSRVVGFRPTGWSYRPPTSRFTENPSVSTVLHSEGWKSRFTMRDLTPQRGSSRDSNCFGVPYSEHSSFRELTMFCCALRIGRVIPTVNVGSARSREKMKGWIEKWEAEKRKNGLFRVDVENVQEGWGSGDGKLRYGA